MSKSETIVGTLLIAISNCIGVLTSYIYVYTALSSQQKLSVRTKMEAAVMASMDNPGEAVERAASGRARRCRRHRLGGTRGRG